MIHPATELRLVNPRVGYGVFASRPIPRGSLVYVQDPLDIQLTAENYLALDELSRELAEKYSFIDSNGVRILSWDSAKFVNHSCNPNTMSTAWGFEIAVRDIAAGEEITDEYGLFNLEWEMECCCGQIDCRRQIRADDVTRYSRAWDRRVRAAMRFLPSVEQPLLGLVDPAVRDEVDAYLAGELRYRSVRTLIRRPRTCAA